MVSGGFGWGSGGFGWGSGGVRVVFGWCSGGVRVVFGWFRVVPCLSMYGPDVIHSIIFVI